MTFTFTPQQDAAARGFLARFRAGERLTHIGGYAGTGKTTLARRIADDVGEGVIFAAFSGKAAAVLESKGCLGATTIHRVIYHPVEPSPFDATPAEKQPGSLCFELLPPERSTLSAARLLIVDEGSMINREIARDLLSFRTPILILSDPFQLPPIDGASYFSAKPDFVLTEVHRQALDNPVLALATTIRNGGYLKHGDYGASRVVPSRGDISVTDFDQILVGTNRTRRANNDSCRKKLGFDPTMPVVGDKIVCLRNQHHSGLYNGTTWFIEDVDRADEFGLITLTIRPEDEFTAAGDEPIKVTTHEKFFLGRENEIDEFERAFCVEFDYGYALTVHKAQGSQWPSVFIVDESMKFRADWRRWLYTAITRASERVVVLKGR
jgi:exodeoxyribonuclease V